MHTVSPGYTTDCIFGSFVQRLNDPEFEQGMAVIWHFLPGTTPLGLGANSRLHSMASQLKDRDTPYKVALIGEDDAVFGGLRQFAGLTPTSAAVHSVFPDMKSALDWVKQPIES